VVIDPNDSSTLYAGTFHVGAIFKSVDSGETWAEVGP
jgi:hypothetical protein